MHQFIYFHSLWLHSAPLGNMSLAEAIGWNSLPDDQEHVRQALLRRTRVQVLLRCHAVLGLIHGSLEAVKLSGKMYKVREVDFRSPFSHDYRKLTSQCPTNCGSAQKLLFWLMCQVQWRKSGFRFYLAGVLFKKSYHINERRPDHHMKESNVLCCTCRLASCKYLNDVCSTNNRGF